MRRLQLPSQLVARGTQNAPRGAFVPELPTPMTGYPRIATEPGPDGLYRDCVIREPHNDLLGRPIYVALDANACELDRMVAVGWEQTEKLLERLWSEVERARDRHLSVMR